MARERKRSLRQLIAIVMVAASAGLAGATLGAQPAVAASTETSGWTCHDTDWCHAGSAPCCDDWSFDHCTTATTTPESCGDIT